MTIADAKKLLDDLLRSSLGISNPKDDEDDAEPGLVGARLKPRPSSGSAAVALDEPTDSYF